MGQYWIPVNLDKQEFIEPHKLASGLKLWEQLANHPGTGAALILLCAAMPERRGGGDLDLTENWHGRERNSPKYNAVAAPMFSELDYPTIAGQTIGRWAGDRIALVGDYAENTDLATEHNAKEIYEKCQAKTETRTADEPIEGVWGYTNQHGKFEYQEEVEPPEFTDISEQVAMVIEHELQGKYKGDGWKDFIYDGEQEAEAKGLKPDMLITTTTEE